MDGLSHVPGAGSRGAESGAGGHWWAEAGILSQQETEDQMDGLNHLPGAGSRGALGPQKFKIPVCVCVCVCVSV